MPCTAVRRAARVAVALVAILGPPPPLAGLAAADPPPIVPNEPIRLFDGRDFSSAFYTFLKDRGRDADPRGVFSVVEGLLTISGEEWGCLTTREEYRDYRLVVEFRWGDRTFGDRAKAARDSGLLIHSRGVDGGYFGTWMHGIECQIIEGGTGDLLVVGDESPQFELTATVAAERQDGCGVWQQGGQPVTINTGRINWWGRDPAWKDVLGFRGARDVERLPGEWNTLECIARGDTLEVLLNGKVVSRASGLKPAAGRIQMQSEGAEIHVRRFDLLPLPPSEEPAPSGVETTEAQDAAVPPQPEAVQAATMATASSSRRRSSPIDSPSPRACSRSVAAAGFGQFGNAFDDLGQCFTASNRNPVIAVRLPAEALARNTLVDLGGSFEDAAPSGAASRVFPVAETFATAVSHAGTHTSACGLTIFRGDLQRSTT